MEQQIQEQYQQEPPNFVETRAYTQVGDRSTFVKEVKGNLIVEEIRMYLRGFDWNGYEWIKLQGVVGISDEGANEVSTFMNATSNINTQISTYELDQIIPRLYYRQRELWCLLGAGLKKYGITSRGHVYKIKSLTFSLDLANLSQALKGHTSRLFRNVVDEKREVSTPQERKRGIFG